MSSVEKRPDLKRKVILAGNVGSIRIIAYEENWNFQPMSFDKELISCNASSYVCVFDGENEIERIDYGKSRHAIEYVEAYVEQQRTPTLKYFEIEYSNGRGLFGSTNVLIRFSILKDGSASRLYTESFNREELFIFIEQAEIILKESKDLESLLSKKVLEKLAEDIKKGIYND